MFVVVGESDGNLDVLAVCDNKKDADNAKYALYARDIETHITHTTRDISSIINSALEKVGALRSGASLHDGSHLAGKRSHSEEEKHATAHRSLERLQENLRALQIKLDETFGMKAWILEMGEIALLWPWHASEIEDINFNLGNIARYLKEVREMRTDSWYHKEGMLLCDVFALDEPAYKFQKDGTLVRLRKSPVLAEIGDHEPGGPAETPSPATPPESSSE